MRKIFARISQKWPEKFLGHLICDFHVILGAIFINSKQVGCHFCSCFYGVCPDFSKVFTNLANFHSIKTFGGASACATARTFSCLLYGKSFIPQIFQTFFTDRQSLRAFLPTTGTQSLNASLWWLLLLLSVKQSAMPRNEKTGSVI